VRFSLSGPNDPIRLPRLDSAHLLLHPYTRTDFPDRAGPRCAAAGGPALEASACARILPSPMLSPPTAPLARARGQDLEVQSARPLARRLSRTARGPHVRYENPAPTSVDLRAVAGGSEVGLVPGAYGFVGAAGYPGDPTIDTVLMSSPVRQTRVQFPIVRRRRGGAFSLVHSNTSLSRAAEQNN